jgi:hypothetical protein
MDIAKEYRVFRIEGSFQCTENKWRTNFTECVAATSLEIAIDLLKEYHSDKSDVRIFNGNSQGKLTMIEGQKVVPSE